mmetsp:Transcript_9998/g.32795  ORF Transcript_9998/g.32795 Transcript_9998/m.32795 type:complete len:339 (-) Transcript_9998:1579-2595(-)
MAASAATKSASELRLSTSPSAGPTSSEEAGPAAAAAAATALVRRRSPKVLRSKTATEYMRTSVATRLASAAIGRSPRHCAGLPGKASAVSLRSAPREKRLAPMHCRRRYLAPPAPVQTCAAAHVSGGCARRPSTTCVSPAEMTLIASPSTRRSFAFATLPAWYGAATAVRMAAPEARMRTVARSPAALAGLSSSPTVIAADAVAAAVSSSPSSVLSAASSERSKACASGSVVTLRARDTLARAALRRSGASLASPSNATATPSAESCTSCGGSKTRSELRRRVSAKAVAAAVSVASGDAAEGFAASTSIAANPTERTVHAIACRVTNAEPPWKGMKRA